MRANCWVSGFANWHGGTDIYASQGDPDLSRYVHFYMRHYYNDVFHSVKFSHCNPLRMETSYQPPLPDDNNWHL